VSAPAFTPGQWAPDKFGEVVSLGKNGKSICMVLNDAEGLANARLIAAAPELYALTERALRWFADNQCAGELAWEIGAALAKARGEQ
jgi:hypothetical protein